MCCVESGGSSMSSIYSAGSKERLLTSANWVKLQITRAIYKNKINDISKKSSQYFRIEDNGYQEHIDYWKSHGFKNIDKRWYLWYRGCSGIDDEKYVPEDIYYTKIEPNLNNQYLSLAYADKNLYEQRYDPNLFPHTALRCINGVFYDRYYNMLNGRSALDLLKDLERGVYVLKPSIGFGGGGGVRAVRIDEGVIFDTDKRKISLNDQVRFYNGNLLVQHKIEQDRFFAQFHSGSVNTMKLYTYYSEYSDEPYVLKSVLRMGIGNLFTDDPCTGGIACGIHCDGRLNSFAFDAYGYNYHEHPDSKVTFEGKTVPNFDKIVDIAKKIQLSNHHFHVLGIDMYVDKGGNAKILEINTRNNEINYHQLHGGSLFGDLTKEVIEISKKQINGGHILWY
jgi:hypothetical protein